MAVSNSAEMLDEIRSRMSESLALESDLDGVDLRVFLYLYGRLNFESYTHIPQFKLAFALNKNKEHISRSIRKLSAKGVLLAGPRGPRSSEWMFNPDYGKK